LFCASHYPIICFCEREYMNALLLVVGILAALGAILWKPLWLLWRYKWSIQIVGTTEAGPNGVMISKPNEVAIPLFLGRPSHVYGYPLTLRCEAGPVFVPYCFGLKWDGHDPWELARIPMRQIKFRFDGAVDQRVWSSDHQAMIIDISGYWRAPYLEHDSLVKVIESGVPFDEKLLQDFMRDEIIAGMRDILAGYDHLEALAKNNIENIRKEATEFFLREDGLFVRSGMCGRDRKTFKVGEGELIIRVEQVDVSNNLREAMATPVTAKYRADAAKETARQAAEEVGGEVLGIVARKHGMTIEDLESDLVAHPRKRGAPIAKGGYAEDFELADAQVARDRAGTSSITKDDSTYDITTGGKPVDANMAGLIGAAKAIAHAFGKGGGGGGRGKGGGGGGGGGRGRRKDPKDMDSDDRAAAADGA
jgi:hypothetical protein